MRREGEENKSITVQNTARVQGSNKVSKVRLAEAHVFSKVTNKNLKGSQVLFQALILPLVGKSHKKSC